MVNEELTRTELARRSSEAIARGANPQAANDYQSRRLEGVCGYDMQTIPRGPQGSGPATDESMAWRANLQNTILGVLTIHRGRKFSGAGLCRLLELPGEDRNMVLDVLERLRVSGAVLRDDSKHGGYFVKG